jgi:hypothetical protein
MQMCAMHVHAHPMFWCAGGAGLAHLQGFQTMILMSDVLLTPLQLAAQALIERIRPVMTVNKLDRCFLELMLDGLRRRAPGRHPGARTCAHRSCTPGAL